MKSPKGIAAIVIAMLGILLVANAVERHMAAKDTGKAMDTIAAGKGWNGEDITPEEQNDRMSANAPIYSEQKSQRNTRGLAGFALLGAGLATLRSSRGRAK